jgi:hypothetical protein
MKKSYLMIATAAALFAACSDSEKLTNVISQPTQNEKIGFVTYSEKTTRANEDNSVNLYDFHKTFDVYSWKTVGTTTSPVFAHTPVEYFESDTQGDVVYHTSPAAPSDEWGDDWTTNTSLKGWFYESVRYWDKLASAYSFFAIAPYEAVPDPELTVANNSANIAIGAADDYYDISHELNLAIENNSIINEKRYFGFSKDYMLADKAATKNQLVTLTFHHILTKLNVKIFIQDSYKGKQKVTITDLKIVGLENNGYFAYGNSMTTNGWTTKAAVSPNTDSNTYDLEVTDDYIIKNSGTQDYSGYYWIQTLVFPQTLTCKSNNAQSTATGLDDKYLYISYTIGTEPFEAYYDLCYVFDNTAVVADPSQSIDATTYSLAQGSEYTLNINVGPEPIIFDATVDPWDVVTDINHTVN